MKTSLQISCDIVLDAPELKKDLHILSFVHNPIIRRNAFQNRLQTQHF